MPLLSPNIALRVQISSQKTPSQGVNAYAEDKKEEFVAIVIESRKALVEVVPAIMRVADEFAAVVSGLVRCEGFAATSLHALAAAIAYSWVYTAIQQIGAKKHGLAFSHRLTEEQENQLTEEDVRLYADPTLGGIGWRFPPPAGEQLQEMLMELDQEVCRAYDRRLVTKRSYPGDEKVRELSAEENDIARHRVLLRPAFHRDHLWLDWHEEEKCGPAKIRDRWDKLNDEERKGLCPRDLPPFSVPGVMRVLVG
jgi:hypothetical protein